MRVSRGPHTEFGAPTENLDYQVRMPLEALTLRTAIDLEQLYGKRLEYSLGSSNSPT
jgi:hypothetical protein